MIKKLCNLFFIYFHYKGKPKWLLVEEKVECVAPEVVKERTHDIETCAKSCQGVSSMFIFGTNDFGDNRCNADGCRCICETSALADGTCTTVSHNGYKLYKYVKSAIWSLDEILHFVLLFI